MQEKNPKLRQLRTRAMQLPLQPGVYLMHDKSGKIIYVGKAKALKNRVSQYFGSDRNHGEKVRSMVRNVDTFEDIVTDSEFEALVLECSLIKQYSPKYNILLKDDKGYRYIRVTQEDWPRISIAKQKGSDGADIYRPVRQCLGAQTGGGRSTENFPAADLFQAVSAGNRPREAVSELFY